MANLVIRKSSLRRAGSIFFRILLVLVLVEIGLRMSGLIHLKAQDKMTFSVPGGEDEVRVMVLGDSMTYGGLDSWPMQLNQILDEKGKKKYRIFTKAEGGETSTQALVSLKREIDSIDPDVVITMLGIDDYWGGKEEGVVSRFFNSLRIVKVGKAAVGSIRNSLSSGLADASEQDALEYAEQLINENDWENAFRVLNETRENDPNNPAVYLYLSRVYSGRGDIQNSIAMLEETLRIDPDNQQALYFFGMIFQQAKEYGSAIPYFERLIVLNNSLSRPMVDLGYAYFSQHDYKRSYEIYAKALQLDPNSPDALVGVMQTGTLLKKDEDVIAAGVHFEELSRLKNNSDWEKIAYRFLALAYEHLNDPWNSTYYYEKAIQNGLDVPVYHLQVGKEYLKMGNHALAEKHFRRSVEQAPDFSEARFYLAQSLEKNKNYGGAEPLFKSLMGTEQENYALSLLVMLYDDSGQEQKTKELLQSLEREKQILVLRGAGMRYLERDNQAKAGEYLSMMEKVQDSFINPLTKKNYQEIQRVLDQRNIPLVAVQYPTLHVDGLKVMFDDSDNVIFVDSENVFDGKGFEEVFRDHDFGTFGHLTPEGNRLVAENVAQIILDME